MGRIKVLKLKWERWTARRARDFVKVRDLDDLIDRIESNQLLFDAVKFDVLVPAPSDGRMWYESNDYPPILRLSVEGRNVVRNAVARARARRRKVVQERVNLVKPFIVAVTAIVVALIGLAAAGLHK